LCGELESTGWASRSIGRGFLTGNLQVRIIWDWIGVRDFQNSDLLFQSSGVSSPERS
jgi:hypothetical protein